MSKTIEVFSQLNESREKFDYFVCGVAGALFAYMGESYTPIELVLNWQILEPIALVCLVLSFYFGVKRIEKSVSIKTLNYQLLQASSQAGTATKALAENDCGTFFNALGGDIYDSSTLRQRRKQGIDDAAALKSLLEKAAKRALYFYKARNAFLFLGFGALLTGKIMGA